MSEKISNRITIFIFFIGLSLLTFQTINILRYETQRKINSELAEISRSLEFESQNYLDILYTFRGFYAINTDRITKFDWDIFTNSLRLKERYSAIDNLEFLKNNNNIYTKADDLLNTFSISNSFTIKKDEEKILESVKSEQITSKVFQSGDEKKLIFYIPIYNNKINSIEKVEENTRGDNLFAIISLSTNLQKFFEQNISNLTNKKIDIYEKSDRKRDLIYSKNKSDLSVLGNFSNSVDFNLAKSNFEIKISSSFINLLDSSDILLILIVVTIWVFSGIFIINRNISSRNKNM